MYIYGLWVLSFTHQACLNYVTAHLKDLFPKFKTAFWAQSADIKMCTKNTSDL